MDIEGYGAVATGGASGPGEATARHLAALGADVTILDFNAEKAAQVAPEDLARLAGDIVQNPYLNGTVIRCDGAVRLPQR